MDKKPTRKEREKQARREEIISAAEKVFIKNGYENSSMDEIAREAEFTIRTLYQYFRNKEDLFLAVIYRGCLQGRSYIEKITNSKKNGYEKIRAIIFAYYDFYRDFPELNSLMNYFSFIKPGDADNPEYLKIQKFMYDSIDEMKKVVDEGKADGSIDPSIDTDKATYAISFSLKSFIHELSASGKFPENKEEISLFALNLLSKTFIGNSSSGRRS